jgi:hypothetical protein
MAFDYDRHLGEVALRAANRARTRWQQADAGGDHRDDDL